MCKLNCGSPLITVVCRTMLSHINKMCNPLQFDFNWFIYIFIILLAYALSEANCSHLPGSFMPVHTGAEKDLRFVYCAGKKVYPCMVHMSQHSTYWDMTVWIVKFSFYVSAAICFMLNNWSGMDKEKAKECIVNCQVHTWYFSMLPSFS